MTSCIAQLMAWRKPTLQLAAGGPAADMLALAFVTSATGESTAVEGDAFALCSPAHADVKVASSWCCHRQPCMVPAISILCSSSDEAINI